MRFVYAVINLLILAGLIYLVGRKSIVKIFRSRREKIARELDEAETPFAPEPLPEMPAPDDTALKSELAAAEKDGKAALLWDRDIKVCYPVYGVFFLKTDTILPPGFDHFLVCHAASATSWDSSISGAEATSLIMPSSTLNAKFLCL